MDIDEWIKEDIQENRYKNYDKNNFTYGFELEIGDVPRDIKIPKELGEWEYSERDVINLRNPYKLICCDPLGKDPPYGGEINTKPTKTINEQINKILSIIEFFKENGYSPTTNCVSHNHIHIHVPKLVSDIKSLKLLTQYIKENQSYTVKKIYDFKPFPEIKQTGTTYYFKFDGGRLMPNWMCNNIINMSQSFEDYIRLHSCGKDGKARARPLRYAVNTYCLKHIKTVEFRFFRHSFNEEHLRSSFEFVKLFMDSALNKGPSVKTILNNNKFSFPKFIYNHEQCLAWKKTKYDSSRGKKERKFYEVN